MDIFEKSDMWGRKHSEKDARQFKRDGTFQNRRLSQEELTEKLMAKCFEEYTLTYEAEYRFRNQ